MLSIFFVIIGLSVLILVHEWGHFLVARWFGLLIEEFGIGFPPRLFSKKSKGTIFSINAVPLGGFVKIYGENSGLGGNIEHPEKSFAYQTAWKRALIVIAGVAMNFLLGWLIISVVFFVGSRSLVLVDLVQDSSPAATAGFQTGDQILGFDNSEKLVSYIEQNRGKEISLKINRSGEELTFKAMPRIFTEAGQGALGLGLRDAGIPRHGLFESIVQGFIASVSIVVAVVLGLYQAIFSPQQVLGPVGIFDAAVDTGRLGIIYLAQFVALISLNLVVLNLLPIPALDGGRLLFIIIEKIRGKRFLKETEIKANTIGFGFLIALIVLVTIKDIAGLF